MSTQKALFLLKAKGDWGVGERDIPTPGPGEILVQIYSAALNPVDWIVQAFDSVVDHYPTVLGSDAAGVVRALGDGVTSFAVGDRVLHQGFFADDKATFQQYAVVPAEIAAKIPDNLSFDQAATIPLAIATPALSFYNPKPLGAGLEPPWEEAGRGKYAGQPILVIGGAASVGQQAIQLAKLSGFSPIITTASLTHESYLKSLGATHIIDRAQPLSSLPSTIAQIISTPLLYAYDSIADKNTQTAAYAALAPGGTLLVVSPPEVDDAQRSADKSILPVIGNVHVESNRPVGKKLYSHLTGLLERGDIKPNNVEVLPDGLGGIPAGLKRLQSGAVRASKLVARPQETK